MKTKLAVPGLARAARHLFGFSGSPTRPAGAAWSVQSSIGRHDCGQPGSGPSAPAGRSWARAGQHGRSWSAAGVHVSACVSAALAGSGIIESMGESRSVIGDWMGTLYGMDGRRCDWKLSLWRSGAYCRSIHASDQLAKAERGQWSTEEDRAVLALMPESGEPSRWAIRDVTGYEFANTLLVLRPLILGSRVLPILLYRIHPLPGPPIPLDAHGMP